MIPGVFQLLGASWRLYRANFSRLAGYLAWLLLPQLALVLVDFMPDGIPALLISSVAIVTTLVLSLWVVLMVMRILSAAAKNQPMDVAIASTGVIFPPYVSTSLVQGIAVLIGLVLFVIPGLIASVWYAFAPIAAALDGRRNMDALATSRALVKGRFWRVAWRILAGPIVFTGWYAIVMTIILIPIVAATNIPIELLGGDNPPTWFLILDAMGQLFFLTPLLLAYLVLLYHSLTEPTPPVPVPLV